MFLQKIIFWLLIVFFSCVVISALAPILPPFIAAFVVAYFFNPLVERLTKYKLSRGAASAIIVLAIVLFIVFILIKITPLIMVQVANLINDIPLYREKITNLLYEAINNNLNSVDNWFIAKIKQLIREFISSFFSYLLIVASGLLKSGFTLVHILGLCFIVPVIAFYALKDWPKIISCVDDIIPKKYKKLIELQFRNIDVVLKNYLGGQAYVCIFLAIFYSIGLSFVGLKYALFIGILTGVLTLVPYIGVSIGIIVAMIVSYIQFGPSLNMLFTLIVFLVGQFIEGNFITPKIVGDKIGLHPIVMILAMFAGGTLIGFTGVLFAIPIAAVIGVIFRFMISLYKNSVFYQ